MGLYEYINIFIVCFLDVFFYYSRNVVSSHFSWKMSIASGFGVIRGSMALVG